MADYQCPFDTSSTGDLHTPPVLERIGNQRIRRNGGNGLVKVLHLDRGQGNFDDIAIGPVFIESDPIADPYHVVDASTGIKTDKCNGNQLEQYQ